MDFIGFVSLFTNQANQLINYIYNSKGKAVGFWKERYIYELSGRPVGQLRDSHVHKLSGQYVGELYKDMIIDKRTAITQKRIPNSSNQLKLCY